MAKMECIKSSGKTIMNYDVINVINTITNNVTNIKPSKILVNSTNPIIALIPTIKVIPNTNSKNCFKILVKVNLPSSGNIIYSIIKFVNNLFYYSNGKIQKFLETINLKKEIYA